MLHILITVFLEDGYMSNVKINNLETWNLSVPYNGYTETRAFSMTGADVTISNGDPEKTIITITIPSTTILRTGIWEIVWSYGYLPSPAIAHTLYFKRNGITVKSFPHSSSAFEGIIFDRTQLETVTNGVSTTFTWTALETGSFGYTIYTRNSLRARWVKDV